MIFILLGRKNALCIVRRNRVKSAEISRFKAGSDLSLYPKQKIPECDHSGILFCIRYFVF